MVLLAVVAAMMLVMVAGTALAGLGSTLTGTNQNDVLVGTTGGDLISGLAGNDAISGQLGNDILNGGHNSDFVSGGAGDDRISGGSNKDRIRGGFGNDTISVADKQVDFVNCGDGVDTVIADGKDMVQTNCENVEGL
ncbi:MAG TPA: calcium-binding protein [Rubrobacteraceae bacterium]|nr:calcium-binding protein [Rubrobacteraceae bacterium]